MAVRDRFGKISPRRFTINFEENSKIVINDHKIGEKEN